MTLSESTASAGAVTADVEIDLTDGAADRDIWVRDTPNALIPKMNELPVSSAAFYQQLILTEAAGGPQAKGPLDMRIKPFVPDHVTEMHRPAVGVLLTFEQGWYQEGLALGELRKSICLAPGEVTKVAVVDWRRNTSSSDTSSLTQAEQIASQMGDMSAQVSTQQSMAEETRQATSFTMGAGSQSQSGGSFGLPLFGSFSGSTSTSSQMGFAATSSAGERKVAAESAKKIQRRTQQLAQSSRSARATQIREVSQSETQTTTTRVIANYNHSHALTMQYFEVLQMYRLRTRAVQADRCVFVPIRPFVFDEESMVAAEDSTIELVRHVLQDIGAVEVDAMVEEFQTARSKKDAEGNYPFRALKAWAAEITTLRADIAEMTKAQFEAADVRVIEAAMADGARTQFINAGTAAAPNWTQQDPTGAAKRQLGTQADRGRVLDQWSWYLTREGGEPFMIDMWRRRVRNNATNRDVGTIVAQFDDPNKHGEYAAKVSLLAQREAQYREARKDLDDFGRLFGVLDDEALRLNQQMWMRTDEYIWQGLLAGCTYPDDPYAGQHLGKGVDPNPVGYFGNYLAFKWDFPRDQAEQAKAFRDRFIETTDDHDDWDDPDNRPSFARGQDNPTIALPSEGIFAEAVLGESNSSEKIDMTRFWNWQESPIPKDMLPPDMEPVDTSSRARAVSLPERLQFAQTLVELTNQGVDKSLLDTTAILETLGISIDGGASAALLADAVTMSTAAAGHASAGAGSAGEASVQASKQIQDAVVDLANSKAAKLATNAIMAGATGGASAFGGLINKSGGGSGGTRGRSGGGGNRGSTSTTKTGRQRATANPPSSRRPNPSRARNGPTTGGPTPGGPGQPNRQPRPATPQGPNSPTNRPPQKPLPPVPEEHPDVRHPGATDPADDQLTQQARERASTGYPAAVDANGMLEIDPAGGIIRLPVGAEHAGRTVTVYANGIEVKVVDRTKGDCLNQFVVFAESGDDGAPESAMVIDAERASAWFYTAPNDWHELADVAGQPAMGVIDLVTDPQPPAELTVEPDGDLWLPTRGGWVSVEMAKELAGSVLRLEVAGARYELYDSKSAAADPVASLRVYPSVVDGFGELMIDSDAGSWRYQSPDLVAQQVVLVVVDERFEYFEVVDGETYASIAGARFESLGVQS